MKRGIAANIGPFLKASIGLAASPLLAKLASDLVEPDGLTVITNAMLPNALAPLPLRAISGVGKGVAQRLRRCGVEDLNALWQLAPKQMRAIWGSVEGERFCYGLHGYDVQRAEPAAKRMTGHSRVLSGGDRQPDGARILARALIIKAASRLRLCDLHAGAMHLSVKLENNSALGHEAVLRPAQNSWLFLRALDAFWPHMLQHIQRLQGGQVRLKLVSCYLHDLLPQPPTVDPFIPAEHDAKDARQAGLWQRIDALNRQTVGLSPQSGLYLKYLGVKIAFSRAPEAAEFEC